MENSTNVSLLYSEKGENFRINNGKFYGHLLALIREKNVKYPEYPALLTEGS
jgi:hypothetical protein